MGRLGCECICQRTRIVCVRLVLPDKMAGPKLKESHETRPAARPGSLSFYVVIHFDVRAMPVQSTLRAVGQQTTPGLSKLIRLYGRNRPMAQRILNILFVVFAITSSYSNLVPDKRKAEAARARQEQRQQADENEKIGSETSRSRRRPPRVEVRTRWSHASVFCPHPIMSTPVIDQ
jgi:hypothetical protein